MIQLKLPVNGADHVSGATVTAIELVEYGDYECPYCGRAYPMVKEIQQELGVDLKFVFRNFPLSKIHPHAFAAAASTEAAALQGKFWEMHDIVFENQQKLDEDNILKLAASIGLDPVQLKRDMESKAITDKVEKDFETGLRSGVNRTPTFFINGEKFNGDWQQGELLTYLKNLVDELI